jgi:hypothetical protein
MSDIFFPHHFNSSQAGLYIRGITLQHKNIQNNDGGMTVQLTNNTLATKKPAFMRACG